MKYTIIFILVVQFVSCKSQIPNSDKTTQFKQPVYPLLKIDSINDNRYPDEILKLGAQKLYDNTKWYLYANLFGDSLKLKKNLLTRDTNIKQEMLPTNTNTTYGMLPLRFENIELRHDSVEIHFMLYFNGIPINKIVENAPLAIGCVFENRSNDEIVLVAGRGDARYWMKVCDSNGKNCTPFENDINVPEIQKYLISNKSKVDPWFYREAVKRGVINE